MKPRNAPDEPRTYRHTGTRGPEGPQTIETDPSTDAAEGWPELMIADLFTRGGDFVASITVPPFKIKEGLVISWGSRVFEWDGTRWSERSLFICLTPFGVPVARTADEVAGIVAL